MIYDDLRAIQEKFGYLPADQIEAVSKRTGTPVSRIHAVASFYPHFQLTPPPRVMAKVCMDMACHVRGAGELKRDLTQRFANVSSRDVSIGEVSCLGQCDGAPAMQINDRSFRNVTTQQAEGLIATALGGVELPHLAPDPRITGLPFDPYSGGEPYQMVRKFAQSRDWDGIIAQLKTAGLAGLGGAGFPTGTKWEAVKKAPGQEKYVICNADESEPGTIKDRFILNHLPYLVVEGMILAGLVTGAKKGYLYIRHEYHPQEHICKHEIEECYKKGILGKNICGTNLEFDLEVFVSPGGYICGEETALIEAIEGHRAEPRNKPPFPVFEGLYHKPTALNNVETFANVPQILANGIDWYKAQGLNGCAGWKFVGVSGDVQKPGVFLVPMGTPMREILFTHAGGIIDGKKMKAYAPSGPSSGYLPASIVDVPIDFKTLAAVGSMMGSGAIVVYKEGRCMLDQALNAVRFFRNESCGKCVPCRMGSTKLAELLYSWTIGKGKPSDLALVEELSEAMKLASICGLGQFAHQPISSCFVHFREEVEAHVKDHRCPEGVCPMKEVA